jgi:hypothetical protein
MKTRGISLLTTAMALSAGHLLAQPIPAGMKLGLATYLQMGYGGQKNDLTEAAEMMPEADYGFKPGSAPEMRGFGQLFVHVAEGQFSTCAALRGVPNPVAGKNLERELRTKQEIRAALADSFTFCDEVFESLTDANVSEFVRRGAGEIARSAVMTGILAHNSEMYGIATVYLRAKNLVPPSTKRQMPRPSSPPK